MKTMAHYGIQFISMAAGMVVLMAISAAGQSDTPTEHSAEDAQMKASLIRQGQATLVEATEIAEKHLKGITLNATSRLQPIQGHAEASTRMTQQSDAALKLMYDLQLYVHDDVRYVTVDGLERMIVHPPVNPKTTTQSN